MKDDGRRVFFFRLRIGPFRSTSQRQDRRDPHDGDQEMHERTQVAARDRLSKLSW